MRARDAQDWAWRCGFVRGWTRRRSKRPLDQRPTQFRSRSERRRWFSKVRPLPRYVGSPDATETPAPVKTTICLYAERSIEGFTGRSGKPTGSTLSEPASIRAFFNQRSKIEQLPGTISRARGPVKGQPTASIGPVYARTALDEHPHLIEVARFDGAQFSYAKGGVTFRGSDRGPSSSKRTSERRGFRRSPCASS